MRAMQEGAGTSTTQPLSRLAPFRCKLGFPGVGSRNAKAKAKAHQAGGRGGIPSYPSSGLPTLMVGLCLHFFSPVRPRVPSLQLHSFG